MEMPLVDIEGLPEPEREETALRLCTEEAQRPFDLTRDVLLRAKLLRLGEADHILILTMHHIASDGWSLGVLSRELSELYAAFVDGKPSPLPELPVQYADFASMAAGLAAGGGAGKAARLLEEATGGGPGCAGAADRPSATRGAELPRRADDGRVAQAAVVGIEEA